MDQLPLIQLEKLLRLLGYLPHTVHPLQSLMTATKKRLERKVVKSTLQDSEEVRGRNLLSSSG